MNFVLEDKAFPVQKAFLHWRRAGSQLRMAKAGQLLEDRVLQPWFRMALRVERLKGHVFEWNLKEEKRSYDINIRYSIYNII